MVTHALPRLAAHLVKPAHSAAVICDGSMMEGACRGAMRVGHEGGT